MAPEGGGVSWLFARMPSSQPETESVRVPGPSGAAGARGVRNWTAFRGIAILLVLLFHFTPVRGDLKVLGPLSGGLERVDLFFVLRGYLIAENPGRFCRESGLLSQFHRTPQPPHLSAVLCVTGDLLRGRRLPEPLSLEALSRPVRLGNSIRAEMRDRVSRGTVLIEARELRILRNRVPQSSVLLALDSVTTNMRSYERHSLEYTSVLEWFRRRDVRTDDGARPPLGSRRSARLLVLGRGVTLACPSASPGACDSDDNSPRIFGGGETSRLH